VRRFLDALGVLLILFALFLVAAGIDGIVEGNVQGGAEAIGAIALVIGVFVATLGIALLLLGRGRKS
jgi:hypothetical protein